MLEAIKRFRNTEGNSILVIHETKIQDEDYLKTMNRIWATTRIYYALNFRKSELVLR